VKVLVGVADVDALLPRDSPLDLHARRNTTSVYTGVRTFPMLPERLSCDLTSLNEGQDRIAFVFEFAVGLDGRVGDSRVYRAWVRNQARLTYNAVAAWLEGKRSFAGSPLRRVPGLDAQLRAQDTVAQSLRRARHEQGALDLETLPAPAGHREWRLWWTW